MKSNSDRNRVEKRAKRLKLVKNTVVAILLCFAGGLYWWSNRQRPQDLSVIDAEEQASYAAAEQITASVTGLQTEFVSTTDSIYGNADKETGADISSANYSKENSGSLSKSKDIVITGISDEQENVKININSASKKELCTLKGIGPSKADSIITYREEHGAFENIEALMKVPGIKEGTFNKIKDRLEV